MRHAPPPPHLDAVMNLNLRLVDPLIASLQGAPGSQIDRIPHALYSSRVSPQNSLGHQRGDPRHRGRVLSPSDGTGRALGAVGGSSAALRFFISAICNRCTHPLEVTAPPIVAPAASLRAVPWVPWALYTAGAHPLTRTRSSPCHFWSGLAFSPYWLPLSGHDLPCLARTQCSIR